MPLAPTAPLLAALLAPGLLFQAPPAPAPPAPTTTDADAEPPDATAGHGTLALEPTGGERPTADRADVAAVAKQITDRTNQFRAKHDLKPVVRNKTLAEAATKYGEYLAEKALFGHEAGGTTPAQRVKAVGYDYCAVRENLAYHFSPFGYQSAKLAEAAVTDWINSPGHRANLLAAGVTETGVGVVHDADSGRYFSVQLFALPSSAAVSFQVENRTDSPQTYRVAGRETTLPPKYIMTHTRCAVGPVTVRIGAAPAANEDGSEGKETAAPLTVAGGQVVILRPADDGGATPELWSPPAEEPAETPRPPRPRRPSADAIRSVL